MCNPLCSIYILYVSLYEALSLKYWSKTVKVVRLGNLVLDFKIWISNLHSNVKSENGFKPWEIRFWISFPGLEKLSLRTAVLDAYA